MVLTEKLLEKFAQEIVNEFFDQGTHLTDGVVKIANRENFNPEQIKRLVEAANNMAFQRKFSAVEGPDRVEASEFETANPQAAIQRLVDAARDVMDDMGASSCPGMSSDLNQDLPITRQELQPPTPMPTDPTAPLPPEAGEPKISGTVMIVKLHKTAAHLQNERDQNRFRFTEAFQKLASAFTHLYSEPFENFEKDAFYKWGNHAAPYLQTLRGVLRKPHAQYDHAAMTKTARVIDSSTPNMQLFREVMQHGDAVALSEKGLEKVQAYLDKLRK